MLRARIVLLSTERLSVQDVVRQAGFSQAALWRWQLRLAEEGVGGLLHDETRPPGKPPHSTSTIGEVLALTCSQPPGEVTHWSGRAVAAATGISLRSVQRIWQEHRVQLHRVRTFKRSVDSAFAEKVEDIVGRHAYASLHFCSAYNFRPRLFGAGSRSWPDRSGSAHRHSAHGRTAGRRFFEWA